MTIIGTAKQSTYFQRINLGLLSNFKTFMDPKSFRVLLFIFVSSSSILACSHASKINVMDYGATGDGLADDSQAFLKAWDVACNASVKSPEIFVPPKGVFLVNPITFQGPCKASRINFMISGTIMAPESPSSWEGKKSSEWLVFKNMYGINVDGFGLINGQGKGWWDQSCRYHPQLKGCTSLAPTALKFVGCNESSVRNIKLIKSSQTHILVEGCNNFVIENVKIDSPGNTPNTDGIHIHSSTHVLITNSIIASGDDCISIGDHISDIKIGNIKCGPGHGISIGSLGKGGSSAKVENIHVSHVSFNGTTNGARIKTWQGGRGYVRGVTFENLAFNNVKNPIIIDQNYCNIRGACPEQETGVQISNVVYREASGTSATDIAINLNCSNSVPCSQIFMESIQLKSAKSGKKVTAYCKKAYGQEIDVVPGPCLQNYIED